MPPVEWFLRRCFFMLQVKVFDAEHEKDLEDAVNKFLETIGESQLREIQFQVAAAEDTDFEEVTCSYAAMILYRK